MGVVRKSCHISPDRLNLMTTSDIGQSSCSCGCLPFCGITVRFTGTTLRCHLWRFLYRPWYDLVLDRARDEHLHR